LHQHYHSYASHFKAGSEWLEKNKNRVAEMAERGRKEQETYAATTRQQRPRNLWAPDGLLDQGDVRSQARRVFNMDYQALIERDNPPGDIVPFIHEALVDIEQRGLDVQGVFRVSPPKPQLDAVRAKIDQGEEVRMAELDEIHVVTGLLKLFLREMPTPLLTFQLYKDWMGLLDLPEQRLQVARVRELVAALPAPNRILLHRLCYTCTRIMQFTEVNKMTANNIAIVLCPSSLYDKDPDPMTMVHDIQRANGVLVLMIENYGQVFHGSLPWPPNAPAVSASSPANANANGNANANAAAAMPILPVTPAPAPASTASPAAANSPANPRPSAFAGTAASPSGAAKPVPSPPKPLPSAPAVQPAAASPATPATPATPQSQLAAVAAAAAAKANEAEGSGVIVRAGQPVDPGVPALPLRDLYPMLANAPDTSTYYWQLFELFEGAYLFSKSALALRTFSAEELAALNSAFQLVGKAIKNMLGFIKDYTTSLPPEVSKRILHAANMVRPHIKTLIAFIKAFNSGSRDLGDLHDTTRQFVAGTLQMFLTCHLSSQMDSISQAGLRCQQLTKELLQTFEQTPAPSQASISFVVNNLQNFTLMFTSVLRARLPELSDVKTQKQLTAAVEGAEKCIGDIFDEARDILLSNALRITPALSARVEQLSKLLDGVMALRALVVGAAATTPVPTLLTTTVEQLRSITELHQADEDASILALVLHLSNLASTVAELAALWERRLQAPGDVLATAAKVVQHLGNIRELVMKVAEKVDDESLKVMLESYSHSLYHGIGQFKLCAASAALGVEIAGYSEVNVATPLLDLAFITFPFLYNFRDAVSLANS